MSAEGNKTAVMKATKVRNKLKGDSSWLQRQNGTASEAEEEKPWMAEVRACRLNSAFAETSPVSSPTKSAPSPTKSAPSPTKAEPERSPSGFIIRGVFTKTDKAASPAPTNNLSGTTQFAKKPSESYKKIAPHTVRSTSENQEGPLSPEEKEKRTEAASSVLRKSAARQRSYVLSAAKKFESPQEDNGAAEAKSPPLVAKRVEITDDDEGSKATPASPVSPVASAASAPQPRPRKTADTGVKTAVDVSVNEPAAPKQQEEEEETKEDEKKEEEEAVAPEPVKEDSPAVSVTEPDPFAEMKPGCTKVSTPLPELTPESVQADPAEVEPAESDAPRKPAPPLLKVIPATPESLSPTLEPEVPQTIASAAPVPEPSAPEPFVPSAPTPAVPEPSVPEPPATSVVEPSVAESPTPSVPEPSAAEPSAPESSAPSVPEPSVAEPSAPESPAQSVPEPSAPESPAPSVPEPSVAEPSAPESPSPSVAEPPVAEPSAPESTAPSVPEPSVPDSPVAVAPALTIPESATLVSITPEPPVPESSDLVSLIPESPAPAFSVMDSPPPVSQAPDLLIPESLSPVSADVESTASVVLEPAAPASVPEPPGPDSPAAVSPPPESPAVPVADLLTPESATLVSSDLQTLVPVSPPQVSVATDAILNTAPEPELEPEPEPEPESSPNISADTLTALSDTLISFGSGSASVRSGEPALAEEEEGSSADVRPTDHLAELEPVPQLSNCVQMTDDLLALSDGPEAPAEPVPPSPGRWSQDLLGAMDGESSQVEVGGALDVLADGVIPIKTEARSPNAQPEEEAPAAAKGTQSPTETVTITTKTVIITDKGEQDSADPVQTSHVTRVITESSLADPFDPRPIGTTSPNRASDLLLPLSNASVNSYSIEEKEPSPAETNMSSDALASLADDVIPMDTGTASLSTRRTWARTWDTGNVTDKSQEAGVEGQDAEQKLVVMFERKSKENDSPWDRWTSPTVYAAASEEEQEEESPEDAQQTQTVTTITTIRETWSEPEPAMDRRTVAREERRVLTPEPEAKKGFVYVKECVNSSEMASHNASWSDSTASSTTYTYSSPSTYSSGPLSSLCTYCGEPVGGDAKITIEHLNINCHTRCFKCNDCSKLMGDLLDNMFIHRGKVNCESCYARAFD